MRWVKDRALQKQIDEAIDRGIAHLVSIQKNAGYWSYAGAQFEPQRPARKAARSTGEFTYPADGGLTACVLYAMGASGLTREHASVAKALGWLENHPETLRKPTMRSTYANSLMVLAWTRLDAKGFGPKIRRTADRIAAGQHANGMWAYKLPVLRGRAYPAPRRTGLTDNSNTQLAVLALWAAYSLADWNAPKVVWQRLEGHYRKTQEADGYWNYGRGVGWDLRQTMTAAGVAGYIYARAALEDGDTALRRARASRPATKGVAAFQRIMAKADWKNYYLVYSIERVGTVANLPNLSWYERGARMLIRAQHKRGYWNGRSLGRDPRHAYETALAILFLSRATYPPIKGAVTPPGRAVTVSPRDTNPTIAKAKSQRRAFEIYIALPDPIAALPAMGARGPELIDYLIGVLERDGRRKARQAAHELIERLLAKRILYLADGEASERAVMADAIRATWARMRQKVQWAKASKSYQAR